MKFYIFPKLRKIKKKTEKIVGADFRLGFFLWCRRSWLRFQSEKQYFTSGKIILTQASVFDHVQIRTSRVLFKTLMKRLRMKSRSDTKLLSSFCNSLELFLELIFEYNIKYHRSLWWSQNNGVKSTLRDKKSESKIRLSNYFSTSSTVT